MKEKLKDGTETSERNRGREMGKGSEERNIEKKREACRERQTFTLSKRETDMQRQILGDRHRDGVETWERKGE